MAKKPYRTKNQKEIMGIILKAAGEGRTMTVSEVHAATSYGSSYGAVRKSLAALVERGMLARVRDGRVTRMVPTDRGYDWFRPQT